MTDEPGECPVYRPDHNGECLLCDEWLDAHAPIAVARGELFVEMGELQSAIVLMTQTINFQAAELIKLRRYETAETELVSHSNAKRIAVVAQARLKELTTENEGLRLDLAAALRENDILQVKLTKAYQKQQP